jgi:hypothetical protein
MQSSAALAARVAPHAAAILAIAIAAACEYGQPPRPASVEPTVAPSDVVFYPHVLYGGDDAYLVDGRWYKPGVGGWMVFTEEPLELQMLRRVLEPPRGWFF